ncbi:hypothetical protein ACWEUT_41180, partial [Actinomadura geliboluensis]
MKIRLTGGVVASGRHAWVAGPSGPVRLLAIASGDDALIDRFARPVLAGEAIGALGITEPGT